MRSLPVTAPSTTGVTDPTFTEPPDTTTTTEPTAITTDPVDDDIAEVDWFDSAGSLDLLVGDTATVSCEVDGYISSVWGSDVQTEDETSWEMSFRLIDGPTEG